MKKLPPIPEETLRRQASAADPGNSAWVSANAGSGKTHVLSQRVVRLLLGGADPSRILCLTYTRAAAANMSNRVFQTLSSWTMLPDAELGARIGALEGRMPSHSTLARARKLFTRALETPGGLKVQTIHAFCESVLHQFPLEANIAAHFEMLDQRMQEALFAEARRDMITGAASEGRQQLTAAFAAIIDRVGEFGLDMLLGEIVNKRDGMRIFIERLHAGSHDRPFQALFDEFGFGSNDNAASIAADIWPLPGFDAAYFDAFASEAEANDAGKVLTTILPSARAAFAETDPVRRLTLLAEGFLSEKGEIYNASKMFKKALVARLPDLVDRYQQAAEAIIPVRDRVALYRMLEDTSAALTVADWLIARYEQLKAGRGFLDFNDLINRTARLLSRPDAGPWVQYKLDKGIDHILLDEAQDTSPEQWSVVNHLAAEFFAGLGARENVERTIFAVGDEKQSIYSFQGASPDSFSDSGKVFAATVSAAGRPFERIGLKLSFRSTDDVLQAVDRVFADPDARRGLTRDPEAIEHAAIRAGSPGYVEVWPSVGATAVDEPEDWRQPVDHTAAPAVIVAERVAATIDGWLKARETIGDEDKRLTAGDIMVLVRKRDRFVHALSRALKNRDIAVAGADRLRLPSHIAIKDLTALGKYLVQPEDDLSLAAVLKSPIFGLDETDLYRFAAARGEGQSLGSSLRSHAAGDMLYASIVETLDRWADEAAFKPVFEFYAGVLCRDGVRKKLITRLGHEAGEILDEFLAFCFAEERTALPGLEAFLITLETAGPEIKREMDQKRDEVRILTVHAAKGLEAPVVFLVDSGSAPVIEQHMPRLTPFRPRGTMRAIEGYLWRSAGDVRNLFSEHLRARLRERADDEYRRLLYVGMTRAEDRLIVCGYHGKRPPSPRTWLGFVTRALAGISEARPHPVVEDVVHRFRVTSARPHVMAGPEALPPPIPSRLPAELRTPLPPEDDLPKPLTPSGASLLIDNAPEQASSRLSPVLDSDGTQGFAVARGLVVHRLLQVLPTLEPGARGDAAERYLKSAAGDWPSHERAEVLRAVDAILADPSLAALFAEGSRAEVSVMGHLTLRGRERVVSGTIDRLAVTAHEVLIVDYKTNRPPPAGLDEVPDGYVLQLALYAELLKPLYPSRKVRAVLLFTETPRLIEIPSDALATALARLARA